jgi:hypothetical protein
MNPKTRLLLIALPIALLIAAGSALLVGCTRTRRDSASKPAETPATEAAVPDDAAGDAALATTDGPVILYIPSRERALARGDTDEIVTSWLPVGARFESARGLILHGILMSEASLGETTLPAFSRVAVKAASEWERLQGAYRRSYAVQAVDGSSAEGAVDSSTCVLIIAESGSVSVGFVERKIDIAGGESLYNVLAIVSEDAAPRAATVTLADTSAWVFPDTFRPSGVLAVSIGDLNGDGAAEIMVTAETIVSLNYLGATPLAWECWLAPGAGAAQPDGWAPIFLFNQAFATDDGASYAATRRLIDFNGDGVMDTVKVTTEIEETGGERTFANTIVSFFVWNGTRYEKQAAQELPRQGTVISDTATLFADTSMEAGTVATLNRGALLYVFDKSDVSPVWYRAVSREGAEGWIPGADLQLSWIDPLKLNREAFRSP